MKQGAWCKIHAQQKPFAHMKDKARSMWAEHEECDKSMDTMGMILTLDPVTL